MYKKYSSLLTALLISSFTSSAVGAPWQPDAQDDQNSTVIGEHTSAAGNVTSNDRNGTTAYLNGSWAGQYGVITSFNSSGTYNYNLYESTTNASLPSNGIAWDRFEYTYTNELGLSDTASLYIEVKPDPSPDSEAALPNDDFYENVDVEFNNRSAQATPLNSARNIKGHLYDSGDKDWYFLPSAGNEIITLEVCPKGTSCFGKKNWVLYVFDSDLFTLEMEEQRFSFSHWVDETGTTLDLTGQQIISGDAGSSNHMYLAYRSDFFEGALIGIVDLCFDTDNKVDIGVGEGARNYLIAISTPLKGDADGGSCDGSVILEEPARSAAGLRPDLTTGAVIPGTYTTTEQFITAFPYSDDQYAIKITGTGINPLISDTAEENSTTFNPNTGNVEIPSVRVNERVYRATLGLKSREARSASSTLQFILSDFEALSFEKAVDAYRATYNPENQQVMIPRVTDTESGKAYSVILQFHPADEGNSAWFDVTSITEIQ